MNNFIWRTSINAIDFIPVKGVIKIHNNFDAKGNSELALRSGDEFFTLIYDCGGRIKSIYEIESVDDESVVVKKRVEVGNGIEFNELPDSIQMKLLCMNEWVAITESEAYFLQDLLLKKIGISEIGRLEKRHSYLAYYKLLSVEAREKVFDSYLREKYDWKDEDTYWKNHNTYPKQFVKYAQNELKVNDFYEVVCVSDCDKLKSAAEADPEKDGAVSSWGSYFTCLRYYRDMLSRLDAPDCSIDMLKDASEAVLELLKKHTDVKQKIRYGAPGTGKSFGIDVKAKTERVVFHPDFDFAQLVGCFKPGKNASGKLEYAYKPQIFTKMYIDAWNNPTQDYCLIIEEINRGNCAQIFGDIFQLLDRDEQGFSRYPVAVDSDLWDYLMGTNGVDSYYVEVLNLYYRKNIPEFDGVGKMALPPNMSIIATMNTSDQSLFPMDSAFKRRFDWEYIPIKYDEKIDNKESPWNFKINLGDRVVEWPRFLRRINANIYKVTQCEDKQMGEFFIKPKKDGEYIDWKDFRSKVLFYLWDSIYKDESENSDAKVIFHYKSQTESYKDRNVTFQSFFESDEVARALIYEICENLNKVYEKDSSFGKKIFEKES